MNLTLMVEKLVWDYGTGTHTIEIFFDVETQEEQFIFQIERFCTPIFRVKTIHGKIVFQFTDGQVMEKDFTDKSVTVECSVGVIRVLYGDHYFSNYKYLPPNTIVNFNHPASKFNNCVFSLFSEVNYKKLNISHIFYSLQFAKQSQ